MCGFYREPGFHSHQPHGSSQPSVTANECPLLASSHQTDTHADRTPIHIWGQCISGLRKLILKFQLSLMMFLVLLSFSEIFQRPLWNTNRELGLLPFPPQPVLESPQPAERDPNCSSPVPCHRLHDHAFGFSRTRNSQDGTEGT